MNARLLNRRGFLHGLSVPGMAAYTTRYTIPGVLAHQLMETGTAEEGPERGCDRLYSVQPMPSSGGPVRSESVAPCR